VTALSAVAHAAVAKLEGQRLTYALRLSESARARVKNRATISLRAWVYGANIKRRWTHWKLLCRTHDKLRLKELDRALDKTLELTHMVDRVGQRAAAAAAESGFDGLQQKIDESALQNILTAGIDDASDDFVTYASLTIVALDGHEAAFDKIPSAATSEEHGDGVPCGGGSNDAVARWRKWSEIGSGGGGGGGSSSSIVPTAWIRSDGVVGVDATSTHVIVPLLDESISNAGGTNLDRDGDSPRHGEGERIIGYLAVTYRHHVTGVRQRTFQIHHGSRAPFNMPSETLLHLRRIATALAPALMLGEAVDAFAASAVELEHQINLARERTRQGQDLIRGWAQLMPQLHCKPEASAKKSVNMTADADADEDPSSESVVAADKIMHAAQTIGWFVEQRIPRLLAGRETVSEMMPMASREEGRGASLGICAKLFLTAKAAQGSSEEEGGLGGDDNTQLLDSAAPPLVRTAHITRQVQRSRIGQIRQRPQSRQQPPPSPRKPPPLRVTDRGGIHPIVKETTAADGAQEFELPEDEELEAIAIPIKGDWGVMYVKCPTRTGVERRKEVWAAAIDGTLASLSELMAASLSAANATAEARGQLAQAVALVRKVESTAVAAHSALTTERAEREAAALTNAARVEEASQRARELAVQAQRMQLLKGLVGVVARAWELPGLCRLLSRKLPSLFAESGRRCIGATLWVHPQLPPVNASPNSSNAAGDDGDDDGEHNNRYWSADTTEATPAGGGVRWWWRKPGEIPSTAEGGLHWEQSTEGPDAVLLPITVEGEMVAGVLECLFEAPDGHGNEGGAMADAAGVLNVTTDEVSVLSTDSSAHHKGHARSTAAVAVVNDVVATLHGPLQGVLSRNVERVRFERTTQEMHMELDSAKADAQKHEREAAQARVEKEQAKADAQTNVVRAEVVAEAVRARVAAEGEAEALEKQLKEVQAQLNSHILLDLEKEDIIEKRHQERHKARERALSDEQSRARTLSVQLDTLRSTMVAPEEGVTLDLATASSHRPSKDHVVPYSSPLSASPTSLEAHGAASSAASSTAADDATAGVDAGAKTAATEGVEIATRTKRRTKKAPSYLQSTGASAAKKVTLAKASAPQGGQIHATDATVDSPAQKKARELAQQARSQAATAVSARKKAQAVREDAQRHLREIATEKLVAAETWAKEQARTVSANHAEARKRAARLNAEMDRAREKVEANASTLAAGSATELLDGLTHDATIARDWDQRSRDRLRALRSDNAELVKTLSSYITGQGDVGVGVKESSREVR